MSTRTLLVSPALLSFSLRNISGQTASDLAEAQGFHDCVCLISKIQPRGFPLNGVPNGNGAPCGQDLHSRKRLLTAMDAGNMKKARRADGKTLMISLSLTNVQHITHFLDVFTFGPFRRLLLQMRSCRCLTATKWRA